MRQCQDANPIEGIKFKRMYDADLRPVTTSWHAAALRIFDPKAGRTLLNQSPCLPKKKYVHLETANPLRCESKRDRSPSSRERNQVLLCMIIQRKSLKLAHTIVLVSASLPK